jgi:hypothetical protein
MIMTVKEAEKKIEELQEEYDNFMKLQNYALCIDLSDPLHRSKEEKIIDEKRTALLNIVAEEADLSINVRTLGTIGCNLCKAEIQRIQTIIDNSKINI